MSSLRPWGQVPSRSLGQAWGVARSGPVRGRALETAWKGTNAQRSPDRRGGRASREGRTAGEAPPLPSLLPAERPRSPAHLCHPALRTWRASRGRHLQGPGQGLAGQGGCVQGFPGPRGGLGALSASGCRHPGAALHLVRAAERGLVPGVPVLRWREGGGRVAGFSVPSSLQQNPGSRLRLGREEGACEGRNFSSASGALGGVVVASSKQSRGSPGGSGHEPVPFPGGREPPHPRPEGPLVVSAGRGWEEAQPTAAWPWTDLPGPGLAGVEAGG